MADIHRKEYERRLREKPAPPALCTNLQRLDSRLSAASRRLTEANEELHRAEVEHRQASEAVEAELARLAPQSDAHPLETPGASFHD